MKNIRNVSVVATLTCLLACASSGGTGEDTDESYGISGEIDTTGPASKSDNAGRPGPSVAWDSDGGQVWSVRNQWTDVTSEAGMAWNANSGLNWNEKYQAWVTSLEVEELSEGFIKETFQLTTPHGRAFTAPVLECAEVAIFMRAAFAAWYHLPFYLEAYDRGQPIYLGHFGFRNADGSLFSRTPNFARAYADYSNDWQTGRTWPSDAKLKRRGLYGGGDEIGFLPLVNGEPARAGAYFDEIFLNKRIGHFMLLALSWFGSMHLADSVNMYHIKAEGIAPGDVLLERWQRRGVGHTIPVMRTDWPEADRLEVAVATGSMPRRYPKWEDGSKAGRYFKDESAGGAGENSDGDEYAKLGGGIRRWRVAISDGNRYRNTFMPNEASLWINSSDTAALAARVADFEQYLRPPTPEVQQQVAIELVQSAREHLRRYPASCSARKNREAAFEELRSVNETHFNLTPDQTDAAYRILDDYVFETMVYDQSITCCWNSTTANMYEIIMDYNYNLTASSTEPACLPPVVFMARDRSASNDGYDLFRAHAESLGRIDEWVAWSEDEACSQASSVVNDTIDPMNALPFCQLSAVAPPSTPNCNDTLEDNPTVLQVGLQDNLRVCAMETDYFTFTGVGDFSLTVEAGEGTADLDVAIFDTSATYIGGSSSPDATFQVDFSLGARLDETPEDEAETIFINIYAVGGQLERDYKLQVLNQ